MWRMLPYCLINGGDLESSMPKFGYRMNRMCTLDLQTMTGNLSVRYWSCLSLVAFMIIKINDMNAAVHSHCCKSWRQTDWSIYLYVGYWFQVKEVGIYLIGCPSIAKTVGIYYDNLWKLAHLNSSHYTESVADEQWQAFRKVPCWSHFLHQKRRCKWVSKSQVLCFIKSYISFLSFAMSWQIASSRISKRRACHWLSSSFQPCKVSYFNQNSWSQPFGITAWFHQLYFVRSTWGFEIWWTFFKIL